MKSPFGAAVYVSYARADEDKLKTVSALQQAFDESWLSLKVDKDTLKPRESFKDFIKEIGRADCIVVLFSDAYFKSFYCMLELTKIIQHSQGDKGVLDQRVIPIFVDGFRLDNKQRNYKAHWKNQLKNWQIPFDELEVEEEYGSEEECQAIVDTFDSIFDLFAYNQAFSFEKLQEQQFTTIIEQGEKQYFRACENNPLLNQAYDYVAHLPENTKTALKAQSGHCSCERQALAKLLSNDAAGIFTQIGEAQQNISDTNDRYKLGELLKHIAPLVLHISDLPHFRESLKQAQTEIVNAGCAHELSAEMRMALANGRPCDYSVQVKEHKRNFILGKYFLGGEPESGDKNENKEQTTNQHILNFTGLNKNSKMFSQRANECLYQHLVPDDMCDSQADKQEQMEDVSHYLHEHFINFGMQYYLLVEPNADSAWREFAHELSNKYAEIVVLELQDDRRQKRIEGRLLDPLRNLTQ